ncbi:MAG: leucine-rich repeat domain-containing protein [Clostridia bacterium]|nr:leucine-rich repeat domain-containing protein [Clostridia bacterium]
MKKSRLCWICFCLAVVCTLFAVAVSADTYGDLTYTVQDGEVTITDCNTSATGALVIPEKINGYPVTSIGSIAFQGCSRLTSIEIPSGVTSIGSYAFSECRSLTSIEIPSSVKSIGSNAFYKCSGLQNTVGNLIYIQTTDNPYFYLQGTTSTSITSCEINANCKLIGNRAFEDCSRLTTITIPSSVTSIGDWAFSGCSGLTSIEIPSSVTIIGGHAFYDCSGLTTITIPSSVKSIGEGAFCNCYADVTILNPNCDIYDDVTTIEHKATIRGYPGSTAQAYANKYKINFKIVKSPVTVVLPVLGVVALSAIILLVVKFSKRRKLQNAESNQNG